MFFMFQTTKNETVCLYLSKVLHAKNSLLHYVNKILPNLIVNQNNMTIQDTRIEFFTR